jgi:hypothetical protein
VIGRKLILQGTRRALPFVKMLCFAVCMLPILVRHAAAQAVPAATWPAGDTSPADQPLPGQQLGTNLTLNQGVNAINAENQSFDHFGLGLQALGGAQTNFLGTQTNQQTAGYAEFSAEGGLLLGTSRTHFFALYQPQYNIYPQYSDVNNFGQHLYLALNRTLAQRAEFSWDTTGARFLSVNQYLPQTLGIGGIGIVVPTIGNQLLQNSYEVSNAATSLRLRYLMSTRMTFTGTLTSSFFLLVPSAFYESKGYYSERLITSGADLRLDYQLTPRDTVGAAITPIYIYGLSPTGHQAAETAQVTYQRQLTPKLTVNVGAGPLFIQSSSSLFGSTQDISYALNAGIARQIRQSQLQVNYSRAFVVNLLSPAIASNSFGLNAYFPITKQWIVIGAATYAHQGGTPQYGAVTVYGGSAQVAYLVAPKLQIFGQYSLTSQKFNQNLSLEKFGFTRNQFGGGIRFNLGNPITRGGVQ